MLCDETHNNIDSLENWHLKVTTDDYQVVAFKLEKADLLHYLSSIPSTLLLQSKALAGFLGTEGLDFVRFFAELNRMQSDVISDT